MGLSSHESDRPRVHRSIISRTPENELILFFPQPAPQRHYEQRNEPFTMAESSPLKASSSPIIVQTRAGIPPRQPVLAAPAHNSHTAEGAATEHPLSSNNVSSSQECDTSSSSNIPFTIPYSNGSTVSTAARSCDNRSIQCVTAEGKE